MIEKEWFRIKKYPHIGLPLTKEDKLWVTKYVQDQDKISSHGFYPFIHRETVVRKYRKYKNKDGSNSELRQAEKKHRELFYANHLDSNVFSYYANLLNIAYEEKVTLMKLHDCVTAYRRIPLNPLALKPIHKSNSDFASDVFKFILNHEEESLIAITFDIESFFDTINHQKLKKAICKVLDVQTLSHDYYNVFKNITRFSYVNENQIFNEFKDDIILQKKSGTIKRGKVKKQRYLKNQGAIAYCETKDFKYRLLSKNLIVKNRYKDLILKEQRRKGIPQGSPISAVLANLYLLNFDEIINKYVENINGLYQRYSDDMVIICSEKYEKDIITLFESTIEERDLKIQSKKTQIFQFVKKGSKFECAQKIDDQLNFNKKFQYLGFEFDGTYSYLKSSSLSSYYRKMKRSINRGSFYAKVDKSKNGIFRSRLYKKFSYKGASRKRVFIRDKFNPEKWIKTERYNWGNFISYAYLSENKLPNNKIRNQIKRHWKILNKLIALKTS